MLFMTDVLTSLTYLLGERTVPTSGTEGRQSFIQSSLEDVYRAYPWKFAQNLVTLSVASGIASLPSDFSLDHTPYVKYYTSSGTAQDLALDNDSDQDLLNIGDNKYWLTSFGNDGNYVLNTKEVITSVVVDYQRKPPALAVSVGTPYDNKQVLVLGARRYYRISQDPEADISQEEALFQKRLQESIGAINMSAPRKRRRTKQSETGSFTGDE